MIGREFRGVRYLGRGRAPGVLGIRIEGSTSALMRRIFEGEAGSASERNRGWKGSRKGQNSEEEERGHGKCLKGSRGGGEKWIGCGKCSDESRGEGGESGIWEKGHL